LVDEDDDPPYVSFQTIGTGDFANPQYESSFGARGSTANRTTGFAWYLGNSSNGGTEIMALDSNFVRIPTGSTATQPSATNGMMRYDTTTNKLRAVENGSWTNVIGGGSVFGSEFQQTSSESESGTTSWSWQQKVSMTTGNLPSGTYRIGFYNETRQSSSAGQVAWRVQLNNTTTIAEASQEPDDYTDTFSYSGFQYFSLSGVNTIDMDYYRGYTGTAYISRARLEIWRVS
jgi:hypothetical protein